MARVLVVDDASAARRAMGRALQTGGHVVVGEARDGAEAVRRFGELRPDVTTMDIAMPGGDGVTALRQIVALDPGARVVMCSAAGEETAVVESIRLGARDFLVKPFQPDRVLGAIDKALA